MFFTENLASAYFYILKLKSSIDYRKLVCKISLLKNGIKNPYTDSMSVLVQFHLA